MSGLKKGVEMLERFRMNICKFFFAIILVALTATQASAGQDLSFGMGESDLNPQNLLDQPPKVQLNDEPSDTVFIHAKCFNTAF
jgi:hypothetical protein